MSEKMQRSELMVSKTELGVEGGCVVAQHPVAAEVGARMLAEGGNAIDAAVAAAFALGVVEPMMSGLGGGGDILVHLASENKYTGIDFLPRTPAAARPDLFELDSARGTVGMYGWPAVADDANLQGYRAVAVPGAAAGLCLAQEKWGTRPLKAVMEPAIALAEEGHLVDWFIAAMVGATARQIRRFPELARVFLPGGLPPQTRIRAYWPVEPLRQPDLARTLKRIAEGGGEEFYRGETARMIVRDMERNRGLLSADDLASYRPTVFERLAEANYRNVTLFTVPIPCGATTALAALNILESFDLGAAGPLSADGLNLIAQALRLAFQDRFAYLADPSFAEVPLDGLMSTQYARERARLIDRRRAPARIEPGDPRTHSRGTGRAAAAAANTGGGCTTHLCVIDRDRNMVSLTATLLDLWGSYVMTPGTGVLLNDGMAWFDPRPGFPNSLAPGKQPLSAGAMMLARKDGRPYLAIGAPGGRKIISAVLQSLVNIIDHGKGPQEAVALPRIHAEGPGPLLEADSRLAAVCEELRAMGHETALLEETYLSVNFARPVAIVIDPATGKLRSGVDPLRPATAVGF